MSRINNSFRFTGNLGTDYRGFQKVYKKLSLA